MTDPPVFTCVTIEIKTMESIVIALIWGMQISHKSEVISSPNPPMLTLQLQLQKHPSLVYDMRVPGVKP